MKTRRVLVVCLAVAAAVVPIGLVFLGHWSVGQLWLPAFYGSVLPTLGFFLGLPAPGVISIALGYSAVSAWNRQWVAAKEGLVITLGALVGTLALFGTAESAMRVRIAGFARLANEAAPIVSALRAAEARMGRAPRSLSEIVPTYLSELPSWSSRLEYLTAGDTKANLYGNAWALRVNAAFGMGFDSFVYFPTQNYPAHFYGGGPERVGPWAYVHE